MDKAPAHIKSLEKMIAMDRKSVDMFKVTALRLDTQGQAWAALMANRLQCRALYAQSLIQLDEAVLAFDSASKAKGLKQARSVAVKPVKAALEYARQMIETYAEIIRNKGDQGLVAQLNEQYYRVIKGSMVGLGAINLSLAKIDSPRSSFKAVTPIDLTM